MISFFETCRRSGDPPHRRARTWRFWRIALPLVTARRHRDPVLRVSWNNFLFSSLAAGRRAPAIAVQNDLVREINWGRRRRTLITCPCCSSPVAQPHRHGLTSAP